MIKLCGSSLPFETCAHLKISGTWASLGKLGTQSAAASSRVRCNQLLSVGGHAQAIAKGVSGKGKEGPQAEQSAVILRRDASFRHPQVPSRPKSMAGPQKRLCNHALHLILPAVEAPPSRPRWLLPTKPTDPFYSTADCTVALSYRGVWTLAATDECTFSMHSLHAHGPGPRPHMHCTYHSKLQEPRTCCRTRRVQDQGLESGCLGRGWTAISAATQLALCAGVLADASQALRGA